MPRIHPILAGLIIITSCVFVLGPSAQAAKPRPLQVFILAGQSNMEGKAKVSLLQTQLDRPQTHEQFAHLQKDGKWIERPDVWMKFLDRKGNLTVGYGSPGCIGPELEFGNVVGDRLGGPVLLIKTAWGGRSLYHDFRSPSSGLPPAKVLETALAKQHAKDPTLTLEKIQAGYGATYRAMLQEIHATLEILKTEFPQYEGQGYELAGLVWFQGWNDMIDDTATAEYATNLANFIRDVRKDLNAPALSVVIGQMGVGGMSPDKKVATFKAAQAKIEQDPAFAGNVTVVHTDQYWDTQADAVFKKGWRENKAEWDTLGSDYPYHYLGSVKTMCAIGKAFGEAMVQMIQKNNPHAEKKTG